MFIPHPYLLTLAHIYDSLLSEIRSKCELIFSCNNERIFISHDMEIMSLAKQKMRSICENASL